MLSKYSLITHTWLGMNYHTWEWLGMEHHTWKWLEKEWKFDVDGINEMLWGVPFCRCRYVP